jgi:hypothetical protein
MSVASQWVKMAKDRLDGSLCDERKTYSEFLKSYMQAEEKTRAKTRIERGCLSDKWTLEDIKTQRILIVGENGIGDEVLTIGCLADLEPQCGQLIWRCHPKLKGIFARSFPDLEFRSEGDAQPTADGMIYSWELIGRLRGGLCRFSWTKCGEFKPYLKAPAALRQSLGARYESRSKKLVGLAWRSERDRERLSDKTCDLRGVPEWAHFFKCVQDKVQFVSLQYGDIEDEIAFARSEYGVEIYRDQNVDVFGDVEAAAAQIAAMDYVVSISTSAAHLAGALGVPGWLLLPRKPFAHWRAGNAICPWYPTLWPIRQNTPGDWQPVLHTLTQAVAQEIGV